MGKLTENGNYKRRDTLLAFDSEEKITKALYDANTKLALKAIKGSLKDKFCSIHWLVGIHGLSKVKLVMLRLKAEGELEFIKKIDKANSLWSAIIDMTFVDNINKYGYAKAYAIKLYKDKNEKLNLLQKVDDYKIQCKEEEEQRQKDKDEQVLNEIKQQAMEILIGTKLNAISF